VDRRDLPERTFRFAVRIVRLARTLDERPGVGRTLGKQVLRSGTSIGANIEEAQAAQSRADFHHEYTIARKEARETNYWLRLIAATETLPEQTLGDLTRESDELIAILTTATKTLKPK
jgi:four helix bundle protein